MDIRELVKSGDLAAIRAALSEGLGPTEEVDGRTLLHSAARYGTREVARLVGEAARARGEIDARHQGKPALWWAVHVGHRPAFEVLLELGADPNSHDVPHGHFSAEGTVLALACDRGHLWAVEGLLAAGADPDFVGLEGARSPLLTACRFGQTTGHDDTHRVAIIESLLKAGADPNLPSGAHASTPLHELATREEFGDRERRAVAALLRHGARLDIRNAQGMVPLVAALYEDAPLAALCFADHGAPLTPKLEKRIARLRERYGATASVVREFRPRPAGADRLAELLASKETPALEPNADVANAMMSVMEEGPWDDGEEWAAMLLRALEISPTYSQVADDVYGAPVRSDADEEGPLQDGWFDDVYSLVDAVFSCLHACSNALPPRFGEVVAAACARLDDCGGVDEETVIEVLRAARSTPQFPAAFEHLSAFDADVARRVELG